MGKPYTVTFGPWLPDLENVGVEMPMQWTETELPCADCLNVYYQDSSYRSLPGPEAFAASLGTPVVGAFTWYDDTAGKEIVFLATANGFFQLEDGSYTQVPVQQNASAGTVGFAISMALGTPFATAVWITPQSQSATSDSTSYTFGTFGANTGNGTPSAYNWTFSGATGPGTWSIASGQGTANAVPEVTGSTAGSTSAVTINCAQTINGNVYSSSATVNYTQNTNLLRTYTGGSGTETVPAGYSTVVVEIWGGGGGGQGGAGSLCTITKGAGGGASGYSRSQFTVTAGDTFSYAIGGGGAGGAGNSGVGGVGGNTVVSGLSNTLTAFGGQPGNISGGSGGSASGGNQANTTGGAGGASGSSGGAAGVASNGVNANNPAVDGDGGGGGRGATHAGSAGAGGMAAFFYT